MAEYKVMGTVNRAAVWWIDAKSKEAANQQAAALSAAQGDGWHHHKTEKMKCTDYERND